MRLNDTIVALASPPGRSPRGILRLSGPDAFAVVDHLSDAPLLRRRAVVAHRLMSNLACLVALYPSPRSYTGEDCCEIILPGNPFLLSRVLDRLIDAGARQAEPGEFTARAFFNGRLTLTEAEGVAATIAASSDAQLRAAQLLTGGRLSSLVNELADELASALALVEAGIDFTDQEDVVPIPPGELDGRLAAIESRLDEMLRRATGAEQLNALPRVVLAGPPNAGKSTLFNALLGRRRAVVSDLSGTTRDVLAEPMHLDPSDPMSSEVLLIDIAGLDESPHGLNPLMQRAAREAIDGADLIVQLEPAEGGQGRASRHQGIEASRHQGVSTASPKPQAAGRHPRTPSSPHPLKVRSKADLACTIHDAPHNDAIAVSAKEGIGLDALRQEIARRLAGRTVSLAADALALQPRHERALRSALSHLRDARRLLAAHVAARALPDVEIIAAEARLALDAFGELAGRITPDDVLGRIFVGFCVGK